jgi:hypothetical protein
MSPSLFFYNKRLPYNNIYILQNYFTAARAFVSAVNDLMATSSEMGILEVNIEAKLKASVVGIVCILRCPPEWPSPVEMC